MVPNRVVLALGRKELKEHHHDSKKATQARLFIQSSRGFTRELSPSCKFQQQQRYAGHASTSNECSIPL